MAVASSFSEAKRRLFEQYCGGQKTQEPELQQTIAQGGDSPAPLALSQEQLFVRETSVPEIAPLYNECISLRMRGPLDVATLERSFNEVLRRQTSLRTSYSSSQAGPAQVVHPAPDELHFPFTDLNGLPEAEQERKIQQVVGRDVREPFDLARGPLWRARLVRTGDFEVRLYVAAHLSAIDGVSVYQVFPRELAAIYRAHCAGEPLSLPVLPVDFRDYARWQRTWFTDEQQASQLKYWRTRLSGFTPLSWPGKRRSQIFRGAIRPFTLPMALGRQVKDLSQREGVTLFVTLLAALVALLGRYTEQTDITLGTPSPSGRKRSEVQQLIGYFLNPVALRFELRGGLQFRELMRQVQRVTLEAIANDDVPIEVVAREVQPDCDHIRDPLLPIAMSLQPTTPALGLEWSVTSMDVDSGGSPWGLYLAFIDQPQGILGRAQYDPDWLEANEIEQLLTDYRAVLAVVSANPSLPIDKLQVPSKMHASA